MRPRPIGLTTAQLDVVREVAKAEQFLGDGVYASYDGFMITVRAPREHGDHHFVMLEPRVFEALLEFAASVGMLEREAR